MPTPTLSFSYLPAYSQAASRLFTQTPKVVVTGRVNAGIPQLAPPFWRAVRYVSPQVGAPRRTVVIGHKTSAFVAVRLTLFWRGSSALPLKGQRYPLSR